MDKRVSQLLESFISDNNVTDKGALSLVVTLTRRWKNTPLPIKREDIETPRGGQGKGLGGPVVTKILADHGITRVLAAEGGRTSRGSLELARSYASLINDILAKGILTNTVSFSDIEKWWIERIREYFNREGFPIQVDPSLSISRVITEILDKAFERQRQSLGSTICGTVLEHLIGAKLELALGSNRVFHKPASTADDSSGASGDFQISDRVFHVTMAPTEALVRRCMANIRNGLRPTIICPRELTASAHSFARSQGYEGRIEVYGAEEFISMNLNELSLNTETSLARTTTDFLDKYNEIIETTENDLSLKIERTRR
jgi:hypothetical protein